MFGRLSLVFVILLSLSLSQTESDNKEDCKYVVYNVHQMNQVILKELYTVFVFILISHYH